MFVARKIVQTAPAAARLAVQRRGWISGPPRVRISFQEKVAHGVVIAMGVVATPLWVVNHMAEYRGTEESDD